MVKNWKDLAEDLKDLAEAILNEARRAFQEGDIEKGVMLASEFRKTIKTAGDLNMIAQGMGELEEPSEEEDIEKVLGIEEEPEEEEPEEEDFEDEEEFEEEEDEEEEEEPENLIQEISTTEQEEKIKKYIEDTQLTLEQILNNIKKRRP
jgi:proline/glutamate/leucine-rich protein 1